MTVCLPFSKIRFLTVNPRTGYILLGFIMFIIIYCYQDFYYLNDIGTVLALKRMLKAKGIPVCEDYFYAHMLNIDGKLEAAKEFGKRILNA